MPRKLGKRPAIIDHAAPRLKALAYRIDAPPERSNWYAAIGDWPLLKNDVWGDCFPAAALHMLQQRGGYTSKPYEPSDEDVRAVYHQLNPNWNEADPRTDVGVYLSEAMRIWAGTGIKLADGTVDQPEAYAYVDHTSIPWIKLAIARFGHCILGLNCPESWLDSSYLLDLPPGQPWRSAGGHAVIAVGYEPTRLGDEFDTITWGGRFRLTGRALEQVADEAVVVMDRNFYDQQGFDPAGFQWDQAGSIMASLGGAPPVQPPPPATLPEPPTSNGAAMGPFWYVPPPAPRASLAG